MSFAERIESSKTTNPHKMLEDILIGNGQLLIGEQPKLVRNGLSTDLLVFPSDLDNSHRGLLHEKVNDAIEYAASFTDIERLNALQYLPGAFKEGEDSQGRWYLTLGLYLYFADECSRKNPKMTFLTALREAGAALPGDNEFNKATLFSKVRDALKFAGIDTEENKRILVEWARHGTYTINGIKHRPLAEDGQVDGAYAQLAATLVKDYHHLHKDGIIVGVNQAISYALGNKEHMHRFGDDDAAAYLHVEETINNPEQIKQHVDQGCHIRHERIWEKINSTTPPLFSAERISGSKNIQLQSRPTLHAILQWFPQEALQFMLKDRQTFVYDDHSDISLIYPKGKLPAEREDVSNTSRSSIAARLSRYRVGFFSNGRRVDTAPIDEETKYMRVAMSSLHELMHIAYRRMTPEERDRLDMLVTQVSEQLRPGDDTDRIGSEGPPGGYAFFGASATKTLSLEKNSLPQILDYRNDYYDGYRQDPNRLNTIDSRREEVICNVFGLMHTEFRDKGSLLRQPPAELPAIGELTKAIDDIFRNVVEQSRKEGFIRYARSSAKENAQTPS